MGNTRGSTTVALAENPSAGVDPQPTQKKGTAFWMVMVAVNMSVFVSALELSSVGVALPTIADSLHGNNFVWVGSAYSLASTAFLPASGGLATIFGRRPVLLAALAMFALGSAICGAAISMNMLIAGRTIQGFGAGGIFSLSEIVVADLVPLRERGKFEGIVASVWALSSVLGPVIGGVLTSAGQWRWLFYLNLPLSGIAAILVMLFLDLHTPRDSLMQKLRRMDWIGIFIIVTSSTIMILALTWGGVQYPWASYQVLLPLILGLIGMALFVWYEAKVPAEPLMPFRLVSDTMSLSGHFGNFLHGVAVTMVIYYLPAYFQSAQEAGPFASGIDLFSTAFVIAPFAVFCGISVEITGRYLAQNYIGWVLIIVGSGTLSTLRYGSSRALAIGLQVVGAAGYGIMYPALTFAVLAPVRVEDNAQAIALMTFLKTLGQTWGVTIGSTILQNGLASRLPQTFLARFPKGAQYAYTIIPLIPGLPDPLRAQVKAAFADSIRVIWWVCAALGAVGLVTTMVGMKELGLHVVTDEVWGLERPEGSEESHGSDLEKCGLEKGNEE